MILFFSDATTIRTSTCSNSSSSDMELDGEMRESSVNNRSSDSEYSHPTTSQPFVDLSSLGLRRSGRKKTKPKLYGFLIMAAAFQNNLYASASKAYNGYLQGYDDFLDANFDGTANSTSILGQMYLSGKMNNEVYTLKEMMKQPDRHHFEAAMKEEVEAMFKNEIWEQVFCQSIYDHYNQVRRNGQD